MRRLRGLTCGLLLVAAAPAPATAPPASGGTGAEVIAPEDLTDEDVRAAIDAIVAEILARKDPKRFWEPETPPTGETSEPGGYTALTLLALLHAGQTYQHPALRDAVAWLEQLAMDRTYPRSVRANLWAMLPPKFQDLLAADAAWLLEAYQPRGGGWTYRPQAGPTPPDNSITQLCALALWEAAKCDVRVDRRYWQGLEDRFLSMQLEDGGWNYRGDGPATGSMTAAGLATLFITQDFLHAEDFLAPGAPRAGAAAAQAAIARGLGWMDRNFSPLENPGRDIYYFYYLYGVERVGLASGYKHFGGHDWFRAAAAEAIQRLCRRDPGGRMSVHATLGGRPRGAKVQLQHLDFALLLLARGRVPVAVNKLAAEGVAWNNRPRDVANLVAWITEDTETALSWQIVPVESDPEGWLDAPVLYLAGHEGLPWAAGSPQLEHLRRYLDLGGLLLAVNEGAASAFAASIEKAGAAMYPQYRFRTLPPEHWAYNLLWPVTDKRPALSALGNGVRELIIVAPGTDFSAAFQARETDRRALYRTATHVYLYGSEMNRPRPRLGRDEVRAAPVTAPATIVRASYDGNWNPEPQALPRAARHLEAAAGIIAVEDRPLAEIAAMTPAPTLVVACGVEPHALSAAEQAAVRDYVGAGGVILFETPGGRGRFTADAERQCLDLFPGSGGIRSLLRDRVVTGAGLAGAASLSRLDYRPYSFEVMAARETAPRLRGMVVGGETRVIFSREDISHGLLDQTCWGISGYASASAEMILANVILHAQTLRPPQQQPPPAPG